jgi:CO/xanthine dehydrogenase Mo-binding subunit
MSNSEQHPKKPSQKLLRTLREMAAERGISFAYPSTMKEARAQFAELKKVPRQDRREQRREDRAVRDAMARSGGASRVRRHELGGYGSTARWKETIEDEPSPEQLDLLQRLARENRESFEPPTTSRQAGEQIDLLLAAR